MRTSFREPGGQIKGRFHQKSGQRPAGLSRRGYPFGWSKPLPRLQGPDHEESPQTNPRKSFGIAFILASALLAAAAEPPPDLARRVAEREGISEAERSRYTYKQWLTVEEFDRRGNKGGIYQERREIVS